MDSSALSILHFFKIGKTRNRTVKVEEIALERFGIILFNQPILYYPIEL
jgi:hypothetical protein